MCCSPVPSITHRSTAVYTSLPYTWRGRGLLLPGDTCWFCPSWRLLGKETSQALKEMASCPHSSSCNFSHKPLSWTPQSSRLSLTGTRRHGRCLRLSETIHMPKAERTDMGYEPCWSHLIKKGDGGFLFYYYCFSSGPADPAVSVQVCDLIKGFTRHLFVCCLEADDGWDVRGDKACLHLRKVLSHSYSQSIFTFNPYFLCCFKSFWKTWRGFRATNHLSSFCTFQRGSRWKKRLCFFLLITFFLIHKH